MVEYRDFGSEKTLLSLLRNQRSYVQVAKPVRSKVSVGKTVPGTRPIQSFRAINNANLTFCLEKDVYEEPKDESRHFP